MKQINMRHPKLLILLTLLGSLIGLASGLTACGEQRTAQQTVEQDGGSGTPVSDATPHQGQGHQGHQGHHGMDHAMSMDLGAADEQFDLRFIDGMILHHQGAIVMAEEALEKSERAEIRQLAQDIIAAQQQEIAQMQQWRQAWYPEASAEPVMYDASTGQTVPMTAAMQAEMRMDADLGAADEQFDLRFINAMIPHHEGAVDMAEQVLERSDRPEMRELAQAIISEQQQEIAQMQQWRQAWYGQ